MSRLIKVRFARSSLCPHFIYRSSLLYHSIHFCGLCGAFVRCPALDNRFKRPSRSILLITPLFSLSVATSCSKYVRFQEKRRPIFFIHTVAKVGRHRPGARLKSQGRQTTDQGWQNFFINYKFCKNFFVQKF